ncbi:SSI family serine proteinase inhibitor [Streptomyces sp. NPDC048002]|uniref:SSI family serine proteinase inhibitor n=1 Tax=Streptomyces sp. NPDC048002 TaxID=3154344 RepID=UPI0033D29498
MLQVFRAHGAHRAEPVRRSGPAGRLGRLLVVAAGSVAAASATSVAPVSAAAGETPAGTRLVEGTPLVDEARAWPSLPGGTKDGDRLTVTVRNAGEADGRYELYCHPGAGDHPDVDGACAALDRGTTWGKDTFAPVPEGSFCTMQYGGPATAHVTGTWAGRPVDARFDRGDGCEIARWDRLVPVLPDLRPAGRE